MQKIENKSINDENKLEIDGLFISIKHKDKTLSMMGNFVVSLNHCVASSMLSILHSFMF